MIENDQSLKPKKDKDEEILDDVSAENYSSVIPDSLARLTNEITGGYEHSAPVRMPPRDELTVTLVPVSLLQRLDELRSDLTLFQSMLWAAIGGIIGFLTNIFTSDQGLNKNSGIFLALLCGVTVLFIFLTIRASRRAEAIRQKIYNETPKQKPEN
jgi:hypothetical protein